MEITVNPCEALTRYLYLDVVDFTTKTIEDQAAIVNALNRIVAERVSQVLKTGDYFYIPIGDGICIALTEPSIKYDAPIKLALELIRYINSVHNKDVAASQQFGIRIGINQNVDNIISDINGRINVCGSGVNYAQRIMSLADKNQILMGSSIWETLRDRQLYQKSLRGPYSAVVKHGVALPVYQYIGSEISALNREIPIQFRAPSPPPVQKLSATEAYFLAYAEKYKDFIESKIDNAGGVYVLMVLLGYYAIDTLDKMNTGKFSQPSPHMPKTEHNTIEEQYNLLDNLPYWVLVDLSEHLIGEIVTHRQYFEGPSYYPIVPNETGLNKLKEEWPQICTELHI